MMESRQQFSPLRAEFTPGPWDWWDDGQRLVRITDAAEQNLVAQAILPSNARLIAAAPELFEALDTTHKLISKFAISGFTDHDLGEQLFLNQGRVHAALAKATQQASA